MQVQYLGTYLHDKNVHKETMCARSNTESTKLRRSDEIERKEQKINNELFKKYFTDDESPSKKSET